MTSGRIVRPPLVAQAAVEPVDGGVVGVDGDDGVGVLRGDPRVGAVVAPEVPREPPGAAAGGRAHERRLAGGGPRRRRSCPRRSRSTPCSPRFHSSRRTSDSSLGSVASSSSLLKPARRSSRLTSPPRGRRSGAPAGRAAATCREHAAAEAVAGRHEHRAASAGGMPSSDPRSQRVERQVPVGLQHQRDRGRACRTAGSRPTARRAQALERADVDEHRARRRATGRCTARRP